MTRDGGGGRDGREGGAAMGERVGKAVGQYTGRQARPPGPR